MDRTLPGGYKPKERDEMNILFFLTPKSEVAYIHDDESLRQVLEKMEFHKYSAVPIISRQGTYVGTITEGDLLWYIKNQLDLNLQEARRIRITNVPRRSDNTPVSIDSNMEDLLDKAMKQNFVPVLDDKKSFIGIITRKDIMKYFANKMEKTE
jgi:predicted transcriptional regulator